MSTALRRGVEKKKSKHARMTSRVSGPTRNVFMKSSIYIYCNYGWGSESASVVALFLLNAPKPRTEREAFFVCVCVYVNEMWRAAFYCVVLFFSLVLHQIQSVLKKKVSVQQENK